MFGESRKERKERKGRKGREERKKNRDRQDYLQNNNTIMHCNQSKRMQATVSNGDRHAAGARRK